MSIKPCLMAAGLLLAVLAGCGTDGETTITVTAYGESFIEEGIPASEVGDDWALDFSRFEVSIRQVSVAGAVVSVPTTIDLSRPSSGKGHELGRAIAAEQGHAESGFTIATVEVDGTATKGAVTKTFRWVFDKATRYTQCEAPTSSSGEGGATFQITIHADHLLYDSLVADEPQVLFQALADADADGNGSITQAELAATDIGAYDPGSEGGAADLWTWLEAQTRTLGHVNGEGHCHATAVSD